ncbi:class I SAM-dependent methyltransferase [Nocardia miyunensis]|uniref:class I SAM-dependent methyltransferase n=1 Tax=Nocardia miyunensis TaxID=282684 RepID=UPI00082B3113|nr:class I SAM-dependent methyltransferase [Nocardia miyunensis]
MTAQRERATSFGSIAQDYDRMRPGPPEQALDWLIPPDCTTALDLAAGTGLFTRALAARVPDVVAVEPDERMRTVLARRSPQVRVLDGRAEAIPLPDASVDAVFVSAAWHWFDHPVAVPEIARVLREGGRLGVLRTNRDRTVDWVFELERGRAGQPQPSQEHLAGRFRFALPEHSPFGPVETTSFAFTRTMTHDEIVDWLSTYSQFIIADAEEKHARLTRVRELLEIQAAGAPTLEVPLTSQCWRTDRLPR